MNAIDIESARMTIKWCNKEDKKDPNWRYWLSAYAGADEYLLIVKDGRIIGSIPGGYSRSIPLNELYNCTMEEWIEALNFVIKEKVKGEYQLLEADGSGTYFYLTNDEDKKYIYVKEYDVPSVYGGMHHNMEIK